VSSTLEGTRAGPRPARGYALHAACQKAATDANTGGAHGRREDAAG
jgi:hypothetical protein